MTWELVPNPEWEDPQPGGTFCHDGTPFLTFRCRCGYDLHWHEGQFAGVPDDATGLSFCHVCREPIRLNVGVFRAAIRDAWGAVLSN